LELQAKAFGELVPRGVWQGNVVSVYSRALNLLHPKGLLVGLVASAAQMSPLSILVPGLFAFGDGGATAGRGVKVGERGEIDGEMLRLSGISIGLTSAEPWNGRIRSEIAGCIADPVRTFERLQQALAVEGADDGLREVVVTGAEQTIFGRRCREILGSVEHGADEIRSDSPHPAHLQGLSELIGLGIGFTPSGDDFISGVLLARSLVAPRLRMRIDRDELESALGRTNDGGRGLLIAALKDQFPAYLLAFASSLAESERQTAVDPAIAVQLVSDAVREAARYGETSGTDAVTGAAWYLRLVGRFLFDEQTDSG